MQCPGLCKRLQQRSFWGLCENVWCIIHSAAILKLKYKHGKLSKHKNLASFFALSAILFYPEGMFVSGYHKSHAFLAYRFTLHQMSENIIFPWLKSQHRKYWLFWNDMYFIWLQYFDVHSPVLHTITNDGQAEDLQYTRFTVWEFENA